ncbi:MAG: hypothetical protein OXI87_14995 [Albidovulum sp.]|nr:hypothetical protein [Albidovulum sp.]
MRKGLRRSLRDRGFNVCVADLLLARGKCVDIAAVARQSGGELDCKQVRESLQILAAHAEEQKRIVEAGSEKHVENGPQQLRAYRIPESISGIGPTAAAGRRLWSASHPSPETAAR